MAKIEVTDDNDDDDDDNDYNNDVNKNQFVHLQLYRKSENNHSTKDIGKF